MLLIRFVNKLCTWRHNMPTPLQAVNMKTVKDYNLPLNLLKETATTQINKHCAILPSLCRHCQSKAQQNMGVGYAFLPIIQVDLLTLKVVLRGLPLCQF